MSIEKEGNRSAEYRRKRVKRLKKMIIFTLWAIILVPYVLCVVLFHKVDRMETEIMRSAAQISELAGLLNERIGYGSIASAHSANPDGANEVIRSGDNQSELTGTIASDSENEGTTGEVPLDQNREALHKVYLTFDDGPSIYTEDILDILDRYGVKATFFVTGKDDEKSKERLQDIVNRGNSLGMHSYSHVYSRIYQSVDSFSEDFHKLQDYLEQVTGVKSLIYRFPGGSSNTVSDLDMMKFADYLHEQGVEYYDWNLSSKDASPQELSISEIVRNAISDLSEYSTSVILMHDAASKRTTVEALPIIIENILAMEDTVILPITEDTVPIQHIQSQRERMED
jgi:peptidoglycan/xylan/chitin deacetylase (PgdA/CDA1 family)